MHCTSAVSRKALRLARLHYCHDCLVPASWRARTFFKSPHLQTSDLPQSIERWSANL